MNLLIEYINQTANVLFVQLIRYVQLVDERCLSLNLLFSRLSLCLTYIGRVLKVRYTIVIFVYII